MYKRGFITGVFEGDVDVRSMLKRSNTKKKIHKLLGVGFIVLQMTIIDACGQVQRRVL